MDRRAIVRMRVRGLWVSLALAGTFVCLPGSKVMAEEQLTVGGSVRVAGALLQNHDGLALLGQDDPIDGLGDSSLRFIAAGEPLTWLKFELHGVKRVIASSASVPDGILQAFGGSNGDERYRVLDARWRWKGDNSEGSLFIDRLNLKLILDTVDIVVGRQAITFGKAYFWNPLDIFSTFGSTEFDRDYKPGLDALRIDLPLGFFSSFSVIGALGRQERQGTWFQSALIGRLATSQGGWDLALQGGKVRGGYQVGGGFVGEVLTVELRGESAWFQPMEGESLDSHLSLVLGLGKRFENSLQLQMEHFFNGGVAGSLIQSFSLIARGRLLQANRNLSGIVANYELHSLIHASMAVLLGWDDRSGVLQPGLRCLASEEIEVLLGAIVAFGDRPTGQLPFDIQINSEFGSYPNVVYLQTKAYF